MKAEYLRWFGLLPIDRIGNLYEKICIERLRRRLAHCGRRITFSRGFYVEAPSTVSIDDDASFGPNVSVMGSGGCCIQDNAMIATGVLILTTSHDRRAPVMRNTGIHSPVLIERDSWIGAGAILLPGCIVRSGAIVGAGAVVSGEVPKNAVVTGVPARFRYTRTEASETTVTDCIE